MTEHLMPTYKRLPLSFTHGRGCWLYDENGNRYLDAISGIAVNALGHAHPAIVQAICHQAERLIHTSNLYHIKLQQQLADKLCALSGLSEAFFANSGAEANETAIKIARKFAHDRGIEQPEIIVAENSFHGRTLATLAATGNPKIQQGFEPPVPGFVRAPFNDTAAIKHKIIPNTCAILLEPVQGEGGVNIPAAGYLTQVRKICDENHLLMMMDEIQTGMGRTGKWFGCQHDKILPDVMTLAKSLANGVPIGACLAHGMAAGVLKEGNHGSTFGGNPLACAAALATIAVIEEQNLVANAQVQGQRLLANFKHKLSNQKGVKDIRGQGLIIGIELDSDCSALPHNALAQNILVNVAAGTVVRLLPPLIMSDYENAIITAKVSNLINEFLEEKCRVIS